jgi:hypothetical protein
MRHSYDFSDIADVGDELDEGGWDKLRRSASIFGQWEPTGEQLDAVRPRVEAVVAIAAALNARRVCSYAVGGGLIERELVNAPGIELTCTEYAPETVARLGTIFPRVTLHDLRDGPLTGFDLHVLHRVDTELSNRDWRAYVEAIAEPHLFAVSEYLDAGGLRRELSLRRRRATKAGWLRTESAFRRLLPKHAERVSIGDLDGYLVTSRL